MRTADLLTYTGPGRVLFTPMRRDEVPGGYRLAPHPLRFRKHAPAAGVMLRTLDAREMWAALHALTYPHEPVLCAAGFDVEHRDVVARWLALWLGCAILPLDPDTHRPMRVHPRVWRTLANTELAPTKV